MRQVPVEDIVIDGESNESNQMATFCEDEGFHAPFALFSPELQTNVGGPYATHAHAEAALEAIKAGNMVPYGPAQWTIDGKPSPWYEKD